MKVPEPQSTDNLTAADAAFWQFLTTRDAMTVARERTPVRRSQRILDQYDYETDQHLRFIHGDRHTRSLSDSLVPASVSTHGRKSYYDRYQCRCELCRAANTEYQQNYRQQKAAQTWRAKSA